MALWSKKLPFVLGLLLPSVAWAGGTAVVAPFVSKGVDAKITNNVTGLVSSELDFSGAFDRVNELEDVPTSLNVACLSSTTCLQGIAKAGSADAVITGSIAPGAAGVQIYLIYYDVKKNAIIRKKTYDVAGDPSVLAEKAGSWIKELTTGESVEAKAAAEAVPTFSASDDDDDDLEIGGSNPSGTVTKTRMASDIKPGELTEEEDPEEVRQAAAAAKAAADAKAKASAAAQAKAAADAKARSDAEAKARAAEIAAANARAAAETKARADAEARAQAEATARAKAEADAKARADAQAKAEAAARASAKTAAAAKPAEEEFSFGSAASSIQVEEEAVAVAVIEDEDEDEDLAPSRISSSRSDDDEDLDAPAPTKSKTSTSRTSSRDEDEDEVSSSKSKTSSRSSEDEDEDEDLDSRSRTSSRSSDDEDEDLDSGSSRSRSSSSDEDEDSSSRSRTSSRSDDDEDSSSSRSRSSSSDDDDDSSSSRSRTSSRSSDDDDDSRSSRSSSSSRSSDKSEKPGIGVTGRVGYSRYYDFNFVTYGGELTVPITANIMFEAGLEGFSCQRELTPKVVAELAAQNNVSPEEINAQPWNTILPFNLGLQYKVTQTSIRPYVGADLTITPYSAEFDVAVGGRVRVGADFMLAEVFGLNLNFSGGVMSGKNLENTQPGTKNTGIIPQISGGTVFAF